MANKITTILDLKADAFTRSWKDARKSVTEADGVVNKFKAGWAGAMDGLRRHSKEAAVVGGAAFTAFAVKAIGEASELEESVNAVAVTFGDAADEVLKIGDNSAKSFGLAKSEFNGLAVQFSSFAKNIAAGTGDSVGAVIEDLSTRVADFASVMNLELSEATQVFMSTLAGETEPIRRFGKDVSAAAVEQYALASGLIETKSQLTETIRVQARYGLLMQQTSDTQGDFANTSDSLANKQRILRAQWKDTAAEIGQDLTPALLGLLTTLQTLVETADKLKLNEVFSAPNALFEGAREWGETTRAIFTGLADGQLRVETENQKITRSFEESAKAAREFDGSVLEGLRTFAEVRAKVVELTGDVTTANIVALDWSRSQGEVNTALAGTSELVDAVTEKLEAADPAWRDYIASQQSALAAAEGAPGTFAEMEAAVEAMAEAAEEAGQKVRDKFAAEVEAALDRVAAKIDEALGNVGDRLDLEDQLDDITGQFQSIAEAAEELGEGGADANRRYQREVRQLRRLMLELLGDLDHLSANDKIRLSTEIERGSLDDLYALLGELTKGVTVPVSFSTQPQKAFDAVTGVFQSGQAPSGPVFINPNPAPQSVSTSQTTIYQLSSSPTGTTNDTRDYDRRNGVR